MDLDDIWKEELSEQDKKRIRAKVVRNTDRTSTRPPSNAPYDFGIDRTWYEAHKSEYQIMVQDYFTYGDPTGFGTEADVTASPEGEDEDDGHNPGDERED